MKTDLRSLSCSQMEDLAESMGQARYRGRQLFGWIQKGTDDFRQMTNLPEVFLKRLEEEGTIGPLEILRRQKSSDGTAKYLFELEDGCAIESVLMKYHHGNTVCISSQAGCRMGCCFCASTLKGLDRNLTPGEMLSQVLDIRKDSGEKTGNVVVMGTGEPLDNYDNLSTWLDMVTHKEGLGMSARSITVSTCGIIPAMKRFAEDHPQVNLAVSLHSAVDDTRSKIMPINRKYPLDQLLEQVREHGDKTGRRVTFEYALIRGVNDTPKEIAALISRLRGMLCHINLISLNSVEETGLQPTAHKDVVRIREEIDRGGIPVSIRRKLGEEISGACGQLRLDNSKKHY